MSGIKVRSIRIGARTYLWRVHHRHLQPAPNGNRVCSEVFSAFQREYGRRPVRILFPATSEHGPEFPERQGIVVDYSAPENHINLNRPRIARLLIELALRHGWSPPDSGTEFVVPNGFHFLRGHRAELETALRSVSE